MMSKREKTIAIVAGSVVGLLAFNSLLYEPLSTRLQAAEDASQMDTADLQSADLLFQRQRRDRHRWRDIAGASILDERSRAEGQLLNRVPEWAQQADLTLTSLKPERNESEQGFGKITVRATAAGDLEAVGRFLFALQNADIPVRVADLTLTSRKPGEAELIVQMGLATIYLPEKSDTSDAGGVR